MANTRKLLHTAPLRLNMQLIKMNETYARKSIE